MDKQTQQNLLSLVKNSYDEIAEDFDTTRQKNLWPEILKLASEVKDGDSVLDVGCGNGRLVEAFKNKEINYLGIDNSQKLIEIAKSKFSIYDFSAKGGPASGGQFSNNFQFSNFQFKIGDVLELDKINEKDFDYVFYIAVLHHLPGDDLKIKALEQIKNKLTDNGKIIVSVWNLWSQVKFRKLILKYALLKIVGKNRFDFGDIIFNWKNNRGEVISQRYYHAFTTTGLKKIIKKSGLKIRKLYKDKFNYYLILEK